MLLVAGLVGCDRSSEPGHAPRHSGRYVGIGTFYPGQMWQRMVVANQPRDAAAATLRDDEQIIVVVDSNSGEIRQCGNLTGYCIGMNPWTGRLGQRQAAPISLSEHGADLERADREASRETAQELETDANAAEAAPARHR